MEVIGIEGCHAMCKFLRDVIFKVFVVNWPSTKFSSSKLTNDYLTSVGGQDACEQLCLVVVRDDGASFNLASCSC